MNRAHEVPSNAKCQCGHDAFYHRRDDGVCLFKEIGGEQCSCVQFTPRNTQRLAAQKNTSKGFTETIGVIGFIFLIVLLYETGALNSLIPHTRVVTVFMHSSGWIVGEYRTCFSAATKPPQDIPYLDCDGVSNEAHDLSVEFWGQHDTERNRTWNCQRSQSSDGITSLTCKLRNADVPDTSVAH